MEPFSFKQPQTGFLEAELSCCSEVPPPTSQGSEMTTHLSRACRQLASISVASPSTANLTDSNQVKIATLQQEDAQKYPRHENDHPTWALTWLWCCLTGLPKPQHPDSLKHRGCFPSSSL